MERKEELILLKSTTIIKEYDDSFSKHLYNATGFFCRNECGEVFLVTNYHVIRDSKNFKVYITLHYYDENGKIYEEFHKDIPFTIDKSSDDVKINKEYDLCVIYFDSVLNNISDKTQKANIVAIPFKGLVDDYSQFNYVEKIVMIGYPNALIDEVRNLPIVREGITATGMCENYNGEFCFIINVPVFHGSSGSPVYYLTNENKVRLVGIVSHFYKETIDVHDSNNLEHIIGKAVIPNGLGKVVKTNILLDLLKNENES